MGSKGNHTSPGPALGLNFRVGPGHVWIFLALCMSARVPAKPLWVHTHRSGFAGTLASYWVLACIPLGSSIETVRSCAKSAHHLTSSIRPPAYARGLLRAMVIPSRTPAPRRGWHTRMGLCRRVGGVADPGTGAAAAAPHVNARALSPAARAIEHHNSI